ncbi:MAG: hypothetical protein ACR2QE_15365 [Acidimicrobiales bacterium]
MPWLGEHADEVLGAELGLDADRLAALRGGGVIGEPRPSRSPLHHGLQL